MKYSILALILLPLVIGADPRMEINDNFCHYMHDNINDDNESFVSDCGPIISITDDTASANGYGYVRKIVPRETINHEDKVRLSNETFPDQKCAMVESNGTTYTSDTWTSDIKVKTLYYYKRDDNGKRMPRDVVLVTYKLVCLNGAQN